MPGDDMRVLVTVALLLVALVGCAADGPQPQLPVSPLSIETARGPVNFRVELASSSSEHATGLMFRTAMAPDAGMLFDFHRPTSIAFWMKNTILPLDMIFIRTDGTISTIHARAVPESETPIYSAEPIRAVLEVNAGRAEALGIEPEDRVEHAIFTLGAGRR